MTVTCMVALPSSPPALRQTSVKFVVAAIGPTVSLPLVALLPLQEPPLAVHEFALVDDQVRLVEPCALTCVGLACSDTVGAVDGAAPGSAIRWRDMISSSYQV